MTLPPAPNSRHVETEEEAQDAFSLHLAKLLDLPSKPPIEMARRASIDPVFLHKLIEARNQTEAFEALIQAAKEDGIPKWAPRSTAAVIKQVSIALVRWASSGFAPVSEEIKEKRRSACKVCPHLRAPSQHLLFKMIAPGSNTCGLCSCAIEKKIALPTETCPVPETPGSTTNRWGEPLDVVL